MPKYRGVLKRRRLYYGYVDYKNRRYYSKGFTTAEEASKWSTKTKSELMNNVFIEKNKITVEAFIIQYLNDYAKTNLRKGTTKNHESILRLYIIPNIGDIKLQELRPLHIQQLQNTLLKSKSPYYVFNMMRLLRQVLNTAVKWDVIPHNPSLKIDLPRVPKKEYTILTPEQLIQILNSVSKRDKAIIALASLAGLRKGEIFGLQWNDIDFKLKTINLRRQYFLGEIGPLKTDNSKAVLPICKRLRSILAEWKLLSGSPIWVFPGRNDKPLCPDTWVAKHFKRILRELTLPPMRFHDLKHTFVSILIGQGVPTADVQQLARHASYQTTIDIYRHLLPNQLEKGLSDLDSMLLSVEKSVNSMN